MVYVDALRQYPVSVTASAQTRRVFGGRQSCHLTAADLSPEAEAELHALAASIGLRRDWYQPLSWPHYDLTPSRRAKAIEAGAVQESQRDGAIRRMAARAQREGGVK